MNPSILESLKQAHQDLGNLISSTSTLQSIESAAKCLHDAFSHQKKVLACGNGGSMCDAMHFTEELSGKFREERRALPAISLSEPGFLTCVGNDYGYEKVFSRGVEAFGQQGDVLVVFTTSGRSQNIIESMKQAKKQNLKVIALVGKCDESFSELCDVLIKTPGSSGYADRVQELHGIVVHLLIELVEGML